MTALSLLPLLAIATPAPAPPPLARAGTQADEVY